MNSQLWFQSYSATTFAPEHPIVSFSSTCAILQNLFSGRLICLHVSQYYHSKQLTTSTSCFTSLARPANYSSLAIQAIQTDILTDKVHTYMETTIILKITFDFFCLYSANVIHMLPCWLHRLNALLICTNKQLMYTYIIPYRGDLHSQRS